MKRGPTGHDVVTIESGEAVRAFRPDDLPPRPPIEWTGERQRLLERATLALGRLDAVSTLLPDTSIFLYSYVRREAVLSSQIEGTQSSLSDLLLFELDAAPGVPLDDVVEVSNYVAALEHGLERLHGGFPLSNRLIRETHERLLASGRGASKDPGRFRRSQNWIGGTRPGNAAFVPPPPAEVDDCMAALERFIHADDPGVPDLVRAALVHVQFETIHPFLDGNGRVGRLLITLMLSNAGILREPMLYLSLYLKQYRAHYYRLLGSIRSDGDWEAWIDFFLDAVESTAAGAVATANHLLDLMQEDRGRLAGVGRSAASAERVHSALCERPILTVGAARDRLGVSYPTAARGMDALVALGIVREVTGRRRDRVFAYDRYLAILAEGTGPE
ncbi:MAG: Fic family protein [Chloroflexi bacterium]|nr:Fic family protein [Chloroflexota bacterium]